MSDLRKKKLQKRLNNANIVQYSLLFYFVHMSNDIVPPTFTVYITPLIYVCVFHRLSVVSVVGIFCDFSAGYVYAPVGGDKHWVGLYIAYIQYVIQLYY